MAASLKEIIRVGGVRSLYAGLRVLRANFSTTAAACRHRSAHRQSCARLRDDDRHLRVSQNLVQTLKRSRMKASRRLVSIEFCSR